MPGFHLFSKGKTQVRSLVIYQCSFKPDIQETKAVSIERTYKEVGGQYRHVETNMDYAIFPRGNTFHLHDVFLTDSFGITVRFLHGKGQFEVVDLKSQVEADSPLKFFSVFGEEEIRLVSYVEAKPVV